MAGMDHEQLNRWLDGRLNPLEARVKRYIQVEARAEVKTQLYAEFKAFARVSRDSIKEELLREDSGFRRAIQTADEHEVQKIGNNCRSDIDDLKTQENSLRRRIGSVKKSLRKLMKKGANNDVPAAAPRPFKPSNNERITALEEENRKVRRPCLSNTNALSLLTPFPLQKLRQENEQLRQEIQEAVDRHDERDDQHAAQIKQLVEQQKAILQQLPQAGLVAADRAVPL
jgi:DNA repair exonuclease SbcCD ATPase subunit